MELLIRNTLSLRAPGLKAFALYVLLCGSTAAQLTEFIWSGGVTEESVRVKAKTHVDSTQVRLAVSTAAELSNPVYSSYVIASLAANNRVADLTISGLSAETQYYYAVEVDGVLDSRIGQFQTFAATGTPASFRIVFGACAGNALGQNGGGSASNHPSFEHMLNEEPLFYLNLGDIHYSDIGTNEVNLFRTAFDILHTAPRQRALYEAIPLVYMWDDHDYGPNNSSRLSPARPAAQLTYREYIPHYPLEYPTGENPVYYSFTVGRVKFIVTDLRSERDPSFATDDATKTMMGTAQKAWFKKELLSARDDHAMIIWVNTFPWISVPAPGADHWGGATTERAELSDFIKDNDISNIVMLSGDAHMVAADDGTNNTYAKGGGPSFPVLQAAAIHRTGSVKGGPYSEGAFGNPDSTYGQYGVLDITDNGGDTIDIRFTGKRSSDSGILSTLLTYSKTFTAPPPATEMVAAGSVWKYNDTGADPGAAWTALIYDDSGWDSGHGNFGYGDTHATTIDFGTDPNNKHITTYFRKKFDIRDASVVSAARLHYQRDDGIIIHVNGVEVLRDNMPEEPVSAGTPASGTIDGGGETAILYGTFSPSLLQSGTNVVAVEVHQDDPASTDLNFDLKLDIIRPASALSDIEQWRLLHGMDQAGGDDLIDPDKDGYVSLLEYLLSGDPYARDGSLLSIGISSNSSRLFLKRPAQSITAFDIQASIDLSTWTTMATFSDGNWSGTAAVNEIQYGDTYLIEVVDPTPVGLRRFMRIQVMAAP